jgi:hypothetical protein
MSVPEFREHLAEDVPTGSFGGSRPPLPAHITPCTPDEQARHYADLADALCSFRVGDALRRHQPASKEAQA